MGRRASNEGSIYRRTSDGRWVGAIHLGYHDGRRQRRVVYGDTQREVREQLDRLRAEHPQPHPRPTATPETLEAFLDRWLDAIAPTVAGPTLTSYESLLRVHVRPTLGHLRLDRLTPLQLQELLAAKSRQGLSPRTVQYIHAVLRRALGEAHRWGLLATNPAQQVRAPRVPRREPRPFTAAEVAALLEAARDERLLPLIVLAVGTGLRLGELLALRWQDVDLRHGTVAVRQTRRRDGTLAAPKSAAGWRDVDLPASITALLGTHRTTQLAQRRELGLPASGEYVFTTFEGGPLGHRHVQRVWGRVVARAGIPPRGFHHLRKTYASLLVERNVDVRTAQELLGHADVRMTLEVYARTSRTARQHAAAQIEHGLPLNTSTSHLAAGSQLSEIRTRAVQDGHISPDPTAEAS